MTAILSHMDISFELAAKYRMNPRFYIIFLRGIETSGMQYANQICTEVDENLFISSKKKEALDSLRRMASDMHGQITQLHINYTILRNEEQIMFVASEINPKGSSKESAEIEGRKVSEENDVFDQVKSISNEFAGRIVSAILMLYGKKIQQNFDKELAEVKNNLVSTTEESIKSATKDRV